ncbi:MAG: hypothetical protein DPW18_12140 [Chloroflexi bacterium]|nr:hypothetical protein [Chloroflexota bacterium]MDL1944411.1 hypothetical protein [Chloroflexi bacterium CFX2]
MAVVSVSEFRQHVETVGSNSDSVMRIRILSETKSQVQMRIFLANRTFLDVYYNAKTSKTAFAQIKDDQRIFGADNAHEFWHWHPYEDPQRHVRANDAVTFDEFLKRVEAAIK